MDIVVSTPEGKDLHTSVQPSDTVSSLRSALSLSADLRLVCKGQVLDESRDLASYGLDPGTEFTALVPTQEQVTVSTLKGKSFLLTLSHTDTIASVKTQIQRIANYKRDRQRLVACGRVLENSVSVGTSGLVTGMTVELLMPDDVLVWVDAQVYCLGKDQDTVLVLKEKIQGCVGTAVEHQVLTFDDRELADTEHLAFLHTSQDHSIHLQLSGGLSVTLHRSQKTVSIVLPSLQTTVEALKQSLEPDTPPEQLSLFLMNQELVNSSTLEDSGLVPNSELFLVLPNDNYLVIKPLASPPFLLFPPASRTIKSLKRKIEARRTIPRPIRLFHKDLELQDQSSLEDYHLEPVDEILLLSADQRTVAILRTGSFAPMRLYFRKSEVSLAELKEEIEQVLGIPTAEQLLSVQNTPVTAEVVELQTGEEKRGYRGMGTNDATILSLRKAKRVSDFSGKTLKELKYAARSERIYAGSTLLAGEETVLLKDLGLRNLQEVSALQSGEDLLWVQVGSHEVSVIAERTLRVSEVKYLLQRDWNFPLTACSLCSAGRELDSKETVECTQPLQLQGSTGLVHVSLPRKLRPKIPRVKRSRRGRRPLGRRRTHPRPRTQEAKKPLLLVIARTSGPLFRVRMREDSSLLALKAVLSGLTGLEISEQRIYSKGKTLKDRRSLQFNNVAYLDLLYVLSPSDILVRAKFGEVIKEIPMNCCATVGDLKQALLGSLASCYCVMESETVRSDDMQIGQFCCTSQLYVHIMSPEQALQPQLLSTYITIRGSMGKLRVKAVSQTVADLKAALCKRFHVSPSFYLYLEGRLLEAEEQVESLVGKALDLGKRKQLSVVVRPPHGPPLSFQLGVKASVASLKAAIKKQEGYSFACITLRHQQTVLQNQQRLDNLGGNPELELRLTGTFQVTVGVHTLEVHARYWVETVKAMCGGEGALVFLGTEMEEGRRLEDYKVGAGAQLELLPLDQLIALQLTWKTVSFAVQVLATVKVETLQAVVARKTGLKPAEQRLYLGSRLLKKGKVLADYSPLTPCIQVCGVSEVHLTYKGQQGSVGLIFSAANTVESLRATVQKLEGMSELPLLVQGHRVLADMESVRSLNPKTALEIAAKDLLRVCVQWTGRICLAVEPSATVSSLRAILAGVTGNQELLLFLSGQLLTDDSASVHLQDGHHLRVLPAHLTVTLQQLDKSTALTVSLNSSVRQLKATIETQLGIPVSKQQLCFRSLPLSDSHLLSHYDLINTPLLTLHICKSLTVFPHRAPPLEVDPEDTIHTIAKAGTQVWYKGHQLAPSMTFAQAGIRTGEQLSLNPIQQLDCQVMHAGQCTVVTLPEETPFAVLKELLAQKLGIPVQDQLLVIDTYAMPDTCVVRASVACSTIELITPEYQPWLIARWTGVVTVITFAVPEGKRVLSIKKELAKRWNIAVEQQILLQDDLSLEDDTELSALPSTRLFFIEQSQTIVLVQGNRLVVPLEATVEQVLVGALQGEHTAVDYHLSYNGKALPEWWTMARTKVSIGAVLDLVTTEEITVRVQSEEKERWVTVRKGDPVSVLRAEQWSVTVAMGRTG